MTMKLSKDEISARLDITEPFLMIDAFEEIVTGKTAQGTKRLNPDDWYFACHLPKSQVMPATLQIEGMLQTLVLLIYAAQDHGEHRAFITNVNVQLVSAAVPETDIDYEAELLSFRRGIAKGKVEGISNGETICRGEFTYASPHLMSLPAK
ncbi:FabA/FabZ family ACP-dehydratase [Magnetovibrio sp. PR-2]|uniref:3-hydroxyacyl-ACP dehydratase FabZ family protein n=1 Tax=Magnetovibrio sp. PR-2 TaxID=3120356 RepID=UPI002FCE0E6E